MRSSAIIAKGDVEYGNLHQGRKIDGDLLLLGLQDIYYAEQQIINHFPR